MDPVLLSRVQFGLSVGSHYIFPVTTFGLTLMILILETLYLRRRQGVYKEASTFLIRILALVFVCGVVTGIVLSVSFGTNWSSFSRLVGHVFGFALAAEAIFAFFLESTFIGVLIFARNRVSPKVYWLSALLVAVGAHLSGLWILIANSFSRLPAKTRWVCGSTRPGRMMWLCRSRISSAVAGSSDDGPTCSIHPSRANRPASLSSRRVWSMVNRIDACRMRRVATGSPESTMQGDAAIV